MLKKLARWLEPYAVPHLALVLIAGQLLVYVALLLAKVEGDHFVLYPGLVLEGEVWRLFSFLLLPPPVHFLFIAFFWQMLYVMGSALEELWGALRFNLYIASGALLALVLGFLNPAAPITNAYMAGAVLLAFAWHHADYEVYIYFVLPVKMKWLGIVTLVLYGLQFIMGDAASRLQVLATLGNFLLFFGGELYAYAQAYRTQRHSGWKRSHPASTGSRVPSSGMLASSPAATAHAPRHQCRACAKNSDTHPELDFRYCSKCTAEDACYCPEHLFSHTHITEAPLTREL